MHLSYTEDQRVTWKFDLYVDKELNYSVRYYEWVVQKQHPVYKRYEGSKLNITLTNFITHLQSYSLCIDSQQTMNMTKHKISKNFSSLNIKTCNLKAHIIKYFSFNQIHMSCCYLIEKQYAKTAML